MVDSLEVTDIEARGLDGEASIAMLASTVTLARHHINLRSPDSPTAVAVA